MTDPRPDGPQEPNPEDVVIELDATLAYDPYTQPEEYAKAAERSNAQFEALARALERRRPRSRDESG